MVKDFGLDVLVVAPLLITTEHVDFDRDAVCGWGKLRHQKRHVVVDHWVITQIYNDARQKRGDVGKAPAIDRMRLVDVPFCVPGGELRAFLFEVFSDVSDSAESREHRTIAKSDRLHVDIGRYRLRV